ncbi:MAG: helicase-exonuclease AddAB subunit AddA [Oscillospiraceae bacterium]|nr:helicase-exonuclease AddAB subunit AddA [Oscillospiraceae bacterium]
MCAFQLSPAQKEAVENRGGTLLVSAAAGSGKTRVLVERLFRYVVEEKADVDDFLIITFTRAAAAELRGRIVEELNKRLAVTPGDGHLRRQLLRVYRADIKTIDSFCAGILRENIHLLEEDGQGNRLTADFRTLDENEAAVLRQRTLQRVLEQYYEQRLNGESTLLADAFGYGRSDEGLEKLIVEIYNKIQSHAYPMKWLRETRAFWESIPDDPAKTPYGAELLLACGQKAAYCSKRLRHAQSQFCDIVEIQNAYGSHFLAVADQFDRLAELAQQGKWASAAAAQVEFPPRLGSVRNKDVDVQKNAAQLVWKQCKETAKEFQALFSVSAEEYTEDMRSMAPAMLDLLTLTEEFARGYREEKTRRNLADFSDQAHDTIDLLVNEDGTPTALGESVSARYLEIMVDEYQDTNEVQNRIFAAVSKQQKNLFLVGDVKQSIYRFRLADPGIFLRKYREFAPCGEAQEGEPRKLLLSKNYRSRPEVLDAVNYVFENILSTRMGEMEYGDEERLYAGNEGYTPQSDCRTEFHFVAMPARQSEFKKLKKQCAEARFVADRIAAMLRQGYGVQGENGLRPVQPEDIVILMRSPSSRISDYRSALEERGIPCSTESSGDFFDTVEIAVTFQLLQLLDNPRQDVPLISVLSSPLFGFTPNRLAEIRANQKRTDFYDALTAAEGEDVSDFLTRLRDLRALAKDKSVSQILSILYDEWNIPGVFGAMEGGVARRENLFTLLEHARRFEGAGYRGLFAFTSQLRQQLEQGKAPVSAGKNSGGGVRIMTIHKSKGLEFPVVFLTDLSHAFNSKDFNEPVLVHPQLGLGPICVDLAHRIKFPTLARLAIVARLKREMKAEEMRILYVAMTRAREKLIMVHSTNGGEAKIGERITADCLPIDPEVVNAGKNLGEWVMMPLYQRPEAGSLREQFGGEGIAIGAAKDYPWLVQVHDGMKYADAAEEREETEEETLPEPDFALELLDFTYPYARETLLPTVISATQLKHIDESESTLPPHYRGAQKPHFLDGSGKKLAGAEAGTATHLLMQYLNFHCGASENEVRKEISRILRDRRISPAQAEAIRVDEVAMLLSSPLGNQLCEAKELHREYRLSLLLDAKELDENAAVGEQIMLHGVVDCWWENEDGTVTVLDFKTDRVKGKALEIRAEEYREQVESYCRALERILEKKVSKRLLYFFSEGRTVSL